MTFSVQVSTRFNALSPSTQFVESTWDPGHGTVSSELGQRAEHNTRMPSPAQYRPKLLLDFLASDVAQFRLADSRLKFR